MIISKQRHIRVLVLSNHSDLADTLIESLCAKYFLPDWKRVATKEDFLSALFSPFDLILADFSISQFKIEEALYILHEQGLDIPFILISDKPLDEEGILLMREGAQDYLYKDNLSRLDESVAFALDHKYIKEKYAQANLALLRSEHLWHSVLDTSVDAILIFDDQWKITTCNETVLSLYGYTPSELIGKSIEDICVGKEHLEKKEEVIEQKGALLESIHKRKDGTTFPIEMSMRYFFIDSASRFISIIRDISLRKSAEQTLRRSELLSRQFVENSSDVFWIASRKDDSILYVSPSFEKIWGQSMEKLHFSRRKWLETVLPEDRDRVGKYYGINASFAVSDDKIKYRIWRPDGSIRWIRDHAFALKGEQGDLYRTGGIAQDITPYIMSTLRKNMLLEISKTFEQFNTIEEAIPKIIQIVCTHLNWKIGVLWMIDPKTNRASFLSSWHQVSDSLENFTDSCRLLTFNLNVGLVGEILNKNETQSIKNVVETDFFIQKEAAKLANLNDALGFPIYLRGHCYGVMEFFNDSIVGIDENWLEFFNDIAKQIGLFMEPKMAEKALILSEQRFRTTFEHAITGISLVSLDGHLLQVNTSLCEMMGFTGEEFLNKNIKEITFSDDLIKEINYINQLTTGEVTHFQTEKRFITKNKDLLWTYSSVSLVRDAQNQPLYFIYEVQDISSRKHTEEKLIHLAYYDILTGLPNKKLMENILNQSLLTSSLLDEKSAIFFININNFKLINDSSGADIADLILNQIALRLTNRIQIKDIIGRWGSDEFIVVLSNIKSQEAASLFAQKLLSIIKEPFPIEEKKFFITASIGISLFPDDANQTPILFKNASLAMTHAKKEGVDNFQFYTKEMLIKTQEKNQIETLLHKAIPNQELTLHYQPIMEMVSGKVLGVEALLRWNSKELGLVPPSKFIPIAEESDLILTIGEWVLREACKAAKLFEKERFYNIIFSINISPLQLKEKNFLTLVHQILKEKDLDPKCLQFEIVESQLMENIKESIDKIKALNELNIQFALDDFGVGYSSFSYLKNFSFDRFKIDISFIRNIDKNPKNKTIVEGIISMSNALGIPTIAEGVETKEEFEQLKRIGCKEAQGYFISYPLPFDQFKEFMLKQKETITAQYPEFF